MEKSSLEVEIWKIINRERKRRKRINLDLDMVKWKKYIMELLGGVENRIRKRDKDGMVVDEKEERTWEK